MTFEEAIAAQPTWVGLWVWWLVIGVFILPLGLFAWRRTWIPGAITLVAALLGGAGVSLMYERMGYVRLLGLPHVVVWTPLALYHIHLLRQADIPVWPKRIIAVVLGTILISLAFDYVDVARYVLGERTPTALPPGR